MNLPELSQTIRKVRLAQGMTVDQLAQKSGFSKGFISQVENFRITPSLKALIRRHRELHRQWQFSAFHFRVILNIYANPEQADQDRSGVLSVGEATALAVALSLDSLTVGVGAGLDQTPVFAAVLISFVLGLAAILLGRWLGDKLMRGLQIEVSWISGLMLLVLAGLKLV